MSNWLFRMGVLYLVVGVILGNVMGATHDYTLHPLHAHLNLLGFAIMMLAGLWFRAVPAASASRLAKAYFWIHQLVFPIQMAGLFVFLKGNAAADVVLGPSSAIMGIGILCLAINVWKFTAGELSRSASAP